VYQPAAETVFPVPALTILDFPGTITTGWTGTGRVVVDRPAGRPTHPIVSGDPALATVRRRWPSGRAVRRRVHREHHRTARAVQPNLQLHARYAGHTLATALQIHAPELAR
jgi:hypothetical protein